MSPSSRASPRLPSFALCRLSREGGDGLLKASGPGEELGPSPHRDPARRGHRRFWSRSPRCSGSRSTIEKVEGMRPYTPLELAGRDIYVREGCYLCHSQMIRSLARRGRALRPLQSGRREHVRPPLPMGVQAHRSRPGAGRRQIFRRVACGAFDRSAGRRAGIDHAGLSMAGEARARLQGHRRPPRGPARGGCPLYR